MDNVIFTLLLFAATLAGYLIRTKFEPRMHYLLNELNPETLDGLSKWALKLCRAAKNQSLSLSSAYARREWVLDQLSNLCQRFGVNLTDEQKRALLEAAYDEMRAEDALTAAGQPVAKEAVR